MRYVVTGGAGFIGSALVRTLVAQGHDVLVIDDLSTGKVENLSIGNVQDGPSTSVHGGAEGRRLTYPTKPLGLESPKGEAGWQTRMTGGGKVKLTLNDCQRRVTLVKGSVTDAELVRSCLEGAWGVFHLAAVASVQRSLKEPEYCREVNVTGTLNVLEAARRCKVNRVVFSSSAAVYGDNSAVPLSEEETAAPISPYGWHKLAAEEQGKLFAARGWGEFVALRYFNVFGPRQDPAGEYAAVIPRFISALMEGRAPTIYGDGRQTRDFLFVEDVARTNILAMHSPNASGEVFNICTGRETSLLDLLAELGKILGCFPGPQFRPARAGDVRRSAGNCAKAMALLSLPPWTPLTEGLRKTVDWFRQNA